MFENENMFIYYSRLVIPIVLMVAILIGMFLDKRRNK